jgi:hypothetical protein
LTDTHSPPPPLRALPQDPAEVHDLSKNLTALLKAMNDTYSRLVFDRRQPASLNFSSWYCPRELAPPVPSSARTQRAAAAAAVATPSAPGVSIYDAVHVD